MAKTVHCDGCGCTLQPYMPATHDVSILIGHNDGQAIFAADRELCGTCLKIFVAKLDPKDWPRGIPEDRPAASPRKKGMAAL